MKSAPVLYFIRSASILFLLFFGIPAYAADLSVRENAGQLEFQIDFLGGSSCQLQSGCSVTIVSQDGTAQAGVHFEAVQQRVSWIQGDGSPKMVVIRVIDNEDKDGTRTFTLNSIDPVGLAAPGSRTVEIIDDESSVLPSSVDSRSTPADKVADVIDEVCPQIQNEDENEDNTNALRRDCNAIVNAAQSNDPNVQTALEAIAPDQAGASVNVARQSVKNQIKNISSRMASLRNGSVSRFAGLNVNVADQVLAINELFPEGGGGAASENGFGSKMNVFLNGEISFGDRDDTAREEGYDFSSYGLTAGVDYRLKPTMVIGGALGLSLSSSDFESGGVLDSTGYLGTLFASYQLSAFYFEGGVSLGSSSYEQDRKIRYTLNDGTNVNQTVASEFDGMESSLFINTGAEILLPRQMSITPRARLEYIKLDVDGFSENNVSSSDDLGEGWRVSIDDQEGRSFLVGLGAQLSKVVNRKGAVWVPYTGLEWLQDFKADKSSVTGTFIGDPTGETFELVVDAPDDSFYKFRLGSTVVFPNGKTAFLDYSTLLYVKHNSVHSINAGMRWEF